MLRSEQMRLTHEQTAKKEQIKDNKEKIKLNKQLPYLVANVVEVSVFMTALPVLYNSCYMSLIYSLLTKIPTTSLKKTVPMSI